MEKSLNFYDGFRSFNLSLSIVLNLSSVGILCKEKGVIYYEYVAAGPSL